METVLKGEKVAGEIVTLSIVDGYEGDSVLFRVNFGIHEPESIRRYKEFHNLDDALRHYAEVKAELCRKSYSLFESLVYCRDQGFTPHETADYLFKLGYRK